MSNRTNLNSEIKIWWRCEMVKIQKCKKFGVCNDCGTIHSDETPIWEIKVSVTGQGWNTMMLCRDCMLSLHTAMAMAATQPN